MPVLHIYTLTKHYQKLCTLYWVLFMDINVVNSMVEVIHASGSRLYTKNNTNHILIPFWLPSEAKTSSRKDLRSIHRPSNPQQ